MSSSVSPDVGEPNVRVCNVVVRNIVKEADSIVRIVLGSQDGSALPAFNAGAHIDVHLPSGLLRQYSLCRLPVEAQYYEIAVLRDPHSRGGSVAMHNLNIGDSLVISAPKNHFPLVENPCKSLLIAGGIGVTPLLPMAQQLQKTNRDFEFHYCAKSSASAAFCAALKVASFADKIHFHFSQTPGSGRMNVANVLQRQPVDTELYVCGPADFIRHVSAGAQALGWPPQRLHREFFAAPEDAAAHETNDTFKVKIRSSGEIYTVSPDQSIYDVLDENGVFVAVSCLAGVCGTCKTAVIDGLPDHRDVFLSDHERAEGKWLMPCCSRSKTALLELDL